MKANCEVPRDSHPLHKHTEHTVKIPDEIEENVTYTTASTYSTFSTILQTKATGFPNQVIMSQKAHIKLFQHL